jgi:hypothetical protein
VASERERRDARGIAGATMTTKRKHPQTLYDRLVEIGLQDPFIRGVVGVVVIAAAASIAISALGSGTKAVITLALCLSFGVVLIILRALMRYADSSFVKFVCFAFSGVIMLVLVVFAVLLVPAAVICWPQPYAQLISLPNCGAAQADDTPFKPVAFTGTGITLNADNSKYLVRVFYRAARKQDAEHVVGALLMAGYKSDGVVSSLDEVIAPNKTPDTTLLKTTTQARPALDEVSRIVKMAIPVKASGLSLFAEDSPLRSGDIQVLLF